MRLFSLEQIFVLLPVLYAVLVSATEVMRRPANYNAAPKRHVVGTDLNATNIYKRATPKTSFAYFTNWGIYKPNFQPTDIDSSILTHILYAFADIAADGTIKLTDNTADEQKHYPGDSWDEPGNNLYGCLKQLYLLKLKQRNLKVLLSVGGWTYSQAGHFNFITSDPSRATFISSAVQLIEDYGFDGIDIDFEFPSTAALGQGFATLLTGLRAAFDQLAAEKGDSVPYELTVAVSGGKENYANLLVPQMDAALTHWNLMAYDFAGPWIAWADNQANLYGGDRTGFSGDAAVTHYISSGATPSKINLGMPLYGRAFENTNGLGQPYNGIGPGTVEAGVYSYKFLPLSGAQVIENKTDVSSYSYDASKKELVTYDTPDIVATKAQYIIDKGLSGSMFWELSTDRVGSDSLVGKAVGVFGILDTTQNHIKYPNSKWDNIRNNMGGFTTPPTSAVSSTSIPTPTSLVSGQCLGITPWSSAATYLNGDKATNNGHLWIAQWWTNGDTPGGPGQLGYGMTKGYVKRLFVPF